MGRYEDALVEFNKALMLDPKNKIAKQYTAIIFKEAVQTGTVPAKATPDVPKGTVPIRKEIVPAPQPKPTPSGTVPSGKQAIASTGTVFRGKETLGTVPSGKQAIASTGTVPMPKKLPAYKLTLQQLVAEAEKNIKLINQKMQKEATTKDQAIEKQLLDLERKKQK
jgi:hypothetical protein